MSGFALFNRRSNVLSSSHPDVTVIATDAEDARLALAEAKRLSDARSGSRVVLVVPRIVSYTSAPARRRS